MKKIYKEDIRIYFKEILYYKFKKEEFELTGSNERPYFGAYLTII